ITVERPAAAWAPMLPSSSPVGSVLFVDGVQRIDAWVWVTGDDGAPRQGVCASWGAGVVRCDTEARCVAAEVRRGVLCPGDGIEPIVTRHGTYAPHPVPDGDGDPLGQALGRARGDLEGRVAVEARAAGGRPDDLLVVDGPLGDRRHIPGAVGYIKSHQLSYLPAAQQQVVVQLGAGERTPLFTVGDHRFRYSWYLRLPGRPSHTWCGIVHW